MRAKRTLKAIYERERPLVFAHRGAMAYAPMNTLAAFELAVQQGADGIELDVWLTMDDVPVIIHDMELDNTTDGTGRVGISRLAEIKELDAGSWFDEKFRGERIPTLDEVFEAVGHKLFVNVEIKSVSFDARSIVQKTVDSIRRHGMAERVVVSSFSPFVLRQMRKVAPDIPIGFLTAPDMPFYLELVLFGFPYEAAHPSANMVTRRLVEHTHRQGRVLNTWTVNDPDKAVELKKLGVDGIITNAPDVILKAIERQS